MAVRKKAAGAKASRSNRPIMVLLDLLGRRWTLRILWELREGPLSFRALQAACEQVSPSVMNARLRELREVDLVELLEDEGYTLTSLAEELGALLVPMDDWAKRWRRRRQE